MSQKEEDFALAERDYAKIDDEALDLCSYTSRMVLFQTFIGSSIFFGGLHFAGNKYSPRYQNMHPRFKRIMIASKF